jgi:hypothetical protein
MFALPFCVGGHGGGWMTNLVKPMTFFDKPADTLSSFLRTGMGKRPENTIISNV